MENGIYLTKTHQGIKLSHIDNGELIDLLVDQGADLPGTLYVGRVKAKDRANFWIDIGLQKPALLQRPRADYQVGQRVLVQLKRPPLVEKYIIKNPEVSDAISISGKFLYYTPSKKGVHFSARIRDKDWKKNTLEALEDKVSPDEGIVFKGQSYGHKTEEILNDISDVQHQWEEIQQLYAKESKTGTVISEMIPSWTFYLLENTKDLIFSDNSDLIVAMKKAGIPENRINFSLKSSWKTELDSLWNPLLEEQVPLTCGGYLLVEEGHTLTAIDVNTASPGDHSLTKSAAISSEIDQLEFSKIALNEAIHQLYLRKIGGLVLIDMPRLSNSKHQKELLRATKSYEDSNLQVLGFTKAGLLEITKRKDEMSLKQIFSKDLT